MGLYQQTKEQLGGSLADVQHSEEISINANTSATDVLKGMQIVCYGTDRTKVKVITDLTTEVPVGIMLYDVSVEDQKAGAKVVVMKEGRVEKSKLVLGSLDLNTLVTKTNYSLRDTLANNNILIME